MLIVLSDFALNTGMYQNFIADANKNDKRQNYREKRHVCGERQNHAGDEE